jgi:uncharacterized membrane protein
MSRIFKGIVWVLFAAVVYLISAGALRSWFWLPQFGDIGFTIVFVLFSVLHCARCEGWMRTGLFFATAAIVSYLLEEVGVRTGLVYGPYHYGDLLGPKLGHVPIVIPLAWFMMIYPAWVTARALLRGVDTRSAVGIAALALIAALVMTAWDAVMDPPMAASGNWVWEQGGAYFGVPLQNYLGWLVTTFIVYSGAGLIWRVTESREAQTATASEVAAGFAALPVIVYAVDGTQYVIGGRIHALHVVALFAMVLPGLLALMQVYLVKKES